MPEVNSNELLKQSKRNICEVFEQHITDENIRQYILGTDGFSTKTATDVSKYVQYIKNVLHLAFYFAYACYKYDIQQGQDRISDLSKQNAKRVAQSLENAFVRYPVTLDLIQFVLTDIQFELSQGDDSELASIFNKLFTPNTYQLDENKNFSFNPYFKLIAEYNRNPSKSMFSKTAVANLFEQLLKKMVFLHNYALSCGTDAPDDFSFVSKTNANADPMDIKHLLFRDDARYYGGIYHLYSIEIKNPDTSKQVIKLKYFSSAEEFSSVFCVPDSGDEKSLHLKNCDVINETTGQGLANADTDDSKNSNVIEQIHTVNYKYIKNLALAISDAISVTGSMKKEIYNKFRRNYSYIFEKSKKPVKAKKSAINDKLEDDTPAWNDKNLNWDTIIIMLLIEASPSVVLEFIIRRNREILRIIGRNLYKRIYDSENFAVFNLSSEKINEEVNKFSKEKLVLGESAGFGKIPNTDTYDKLFPKAAAMLIISKLTLLQESESDDSLVYTGNLCNNINFLTNSANNTSDEKRIKNSCIILGETLKHIICFYAGLIQYGKGKGQFDLLTYDKCLVKDELENAQRDLEKSFIDAARAESKNVRNIIPTTPPVVIELMDRFIAFCADIANNELLRDYLYTAVGKYEIIDLGIMKAFRARLSDTSGNAYDCDADEWVDITLEILEYLKTGSDSSTSIDSDLFNAIYPFTAAFNRRRENLDGYKTVNFSLNIDIDDDNNIDYRADINVLSEFTYNRSDVYYCLPNVLRSNHKWWIDPVLISFRKFNNIFTAEGDEYA